MLKGKRIVLGVTGGIAAYKSAALCSKLVQEGADVRVIMTKSAVKFVTPLTFQALSRNFVMTDTFEEKDPSVISHIDLADTAELFVIAPATANILAKMAWGLADDMLSTTLLATTAPILVAPAMNVHMYAHPAVQNNLAILRQRGVFICEPQEGPLACGYVGKGRLAEPEVIFGEIVRILGQGTKHQRLAGKTVLITSGATKERIDPVRYITNDSSGKMGCALAEAARDMGARVILVAGRMSVPAPEGVTLIPVTTAEEMFQAVLARFDEADVVIKAAAVADYRPVKTAERKIKKTENFLTLELEKTPDILKALGERKKGQMLVGFAAETDSLELNAMAKLKQKNCDLLVANDVTQPGAGFDQDTNILHIFDRDGLVKSLPLMEKKEAARHLMNLIADRLHSGS